MSSIRPSDVDESTDPNEVPLWTRNFLLLCLSSFFFFLSFNTIIAELPEWIDRMGEKRMLPYVIPIFTLAALLSRPFSGHLADTVGRRPVIFVGLIVSVLCGMVYPLVLTIQGFFIASLSTRVLHRVCTYRYHRIAYGHHRAETPRRRHGHSGLIRQHGHGNWATSR